MNADSMNEREPRVMTLRPSRSHDGEVIVSAVVSTCESAKYPLPGRSGDWVRGSGVLSSWIGSA